MNEIICTTQAELDAVPVDFDGRVIVKFGTPYNRAVINRRFKYAVVAWGNSSVEARGNSSVEAWGNSSVVAWGNSSVVARENSSVEAWENSSVEARGNSSVEAWENSSVVAWGNSSVEARGNSSVEAWGNSSVVAWGNSSVVARENSSVEARGNSSVEAWENSSVEARGNSSVEARGNSSVEAWGNSSVEAWGNSSVVAWGNSSVEARGNSSVEGSGNAQIVDDARKGNVKVSGNARIVYNPANIDEYIDFHGLESTESTVRLFKAVHFNGEKYYADADPDFVYAIGDIAVPTNGFDDNVNKTCGAGINLAHKAWALNYGCGWEDLAILELECEKADVLVPLMSDGKVRARKAKVIREVPLEECGLYGKMLAKQRANK